MSAAVAAPNNGRGQGPPTASPEGTCSVDGDRVVGVDLPTWELMNFLITDASGTDGWVLGYTSSGSRSVTVPDRAGPTTYEFTGVLKGKDGKKYKVYASCSADD